MQNAVHTAITTHAPQRLYPSCHCSARVAYTPLTHAVEQQPSPTASLQHDHMQLHCRRDSPLVRIVVASY